MFRKGKALGELGFFEKAVKILEDLKKKNPTGTARRRFTNAALYRLMFLTDVALVDTELSRLRAIDNEREKIHKQKLKGMVFHRTSQAKSNNIHCLGFLMRDGKKPAASAGASSSSTSTSAPKTAPESSKMPAVTPGFIEEVTDDD